jgi:hypothetical protein
VHPQSGAEPNFLSNGISARASSPQVASKRKSLWPNAKLLKRKHNEVAAEIFKSERRMLKPVNNLLDFTRTQLGSGLPIKVKKTDVVNIGLGAVEELRHLRRILWPEYWTQIGSAQQLEHARGIRGFPGPSFKNCTCREMDCHTGERASYS